MEDKNQEPIEETTSGGVTSVDLKIGDLAVSTYLLSPLQDHNQLLSLVKTILTDDDMKNYLMEIKAKKINGTSYTG